MTRQERRQWATDHARRMAPFILTGVITLGVNVVIQASGVSESCQAEIKGYCARVIEKVLAKL